MIGMQYKIKLPNDYDMEIVRNRVRDNGHKMDGFQGLHFKAYLITETDKNGNFYNSYAPLYVWENTEGMNHFIFEGFYDNILGSFGWQHINIGVPFALQLDKDFNKSKYVVEYAGTIPERKSLINLSFHMSNENLKNAPKCTGEVIIYNPDQWVYSHFRFYHEQPVIDPEEQITVYQILHISL